MLVHTCSSVAGSRQKISYIVCGATPYFSSTAGSGIPSWSGDCRTMVLLLKRITVT